MRTHACGARSSAGARLSPLLFIVKQVAPAELSAFFSFGSARKQIAPPARMRRFAPSCSRTSLRSSYLLPIVPWCARCGARLSLLCHTCGALCFFPFGSARAPPARIRRFAHSCSRTSLRSSYLGARCRLAHSLFLSSSPSSSPFLRTPTSKCKNLRTPTSKRARARARI